MRRAVGIGGLSRSSAISRLAASMTRRSSCRGPAESKDAGGSSTRTRPGAATLNDCRCCHSVGASAAWPATANRANRLGRRRKGFFIAGQKALVGERREDGDDRHGKQCADAVKRLEPREIVKEKLEQRDTEQRDGRVARGAGLLPDAGAQEAEREERPGDGVGHVARKIAGKLQGQRLRAGRGEVVGDLDVEEQEREDDPEGVEERRGGEPGHPLRRGGPRARPRGKRRGRQAAGGESPDEKGRGAAAIV